MRNRYQNPSLPQNARRAIKLPSRKQFLSLPQKIISPHKKEIGIEVCNSTMNKNIILSYFFSSLRNKQNTQSPKRAMPILNIRYIKNPGAVINGTARINLISKYQDKLNAKFASVQISKNVHELRIKIPTPKTREIKSPTIKITKLRASVNKERKVGRFHIIDSPTEQFSLPRIEQKSCCDRYAESYKWKYDKNRSIDYIHEIDCQDHHKTVDPKNSVKRKDSICPWEIDSDENN